MEPQAVLHGTKGMCMFYARLCMFVLMFLCLQVLCSYERVFVLNISVSKLFVLCMRLSTYWFNCLLMLSLPANLPAAQHSPRGHR